MKTFVQLKTVNTTPRKYIISVAKPAIQMERVHLSVAKASGFILENIYNPKPHSHNMTNNMEEKIRVKISQFANCMIERASVTDNEDYAEASLQAAKRADELIEIINQELALLKQKALSLIPEEIGMTGMIEDMRKRDGYNACRTATITNLTEKL